MKAISSVWIVGGLVLGYLTAADAVRAQIVPDNTLPNNSIVEAGCTNCTIEGGTTQGGNLFHSFRNFSVPTGGSASFNNAPQIANILTRVTGNSVSNINGLLRSNGAANLFLLNPNGVIFGPNARLNIGGSFVTSTADAIAFPNGETFSATNPQAPPLLTVNAPIGLQFGASSGSIGVQGSLQVASGQTLALVGSGVTINGGRLTAPGGRIELGSVAAGSLVAMTSTNPGWTLNYQGVQQFQDIRLTQAASVDASGDGGGSIQVQGQRLSLKEGSQIFILTLGTQARRDLIVRTTESVEVIGINSQNGSPSRLATQASPDLTGNGGNLTIETGSLRVVDGARVTATTSGASNGGDLTVRAQSVEVIGSNPVNGSSSFLLAQAGRGSTGNTGNLTITTDSLRIAEGAQVVTNTFGTGNSGDLTVRAQSVEVLGSDPIDGSPSFLSTQAGSGSGNAGSLTITTDSLRIAERAVVSASTFGAGKGGDLTVRAQSVEVIGSNPVNGSSSFLSSLAGPSSTGNAGSLTITTDSLRIAEGAEVSTGTFSAGNGGDLTVRAQSVEVIGSDPVDGSSSSLSAQASLGSTGNAGSLTITTDSLRIAEGAAVSTSTFGAGNGGDLTVRAQSVEVIGFNSQSGLPSLLVAQTTPGSTGNAGDISLSTDRLYVANRSEIQATSLGTGIAGNIEIQAASRITLADEASINSNTNAGQGNITFTTPLLLLRRASSITTNASGNAIGGNIRFNGGFLVAIPSEDSNITANAFAGSGGRVDITAQGIFGIGFRPRVTPLSDITASSELGTPGTILLNTLNLDPSQGLTALPTDLTDASNLIAIGCTSPAAVQTNRGEFYQTGRGGIAPSPTDTLSSSDILEDLQPPNAWTTATTPVPIQEAQGWQRSDHGEIILVATPTHRWRCGRSGG